MRNFVWMALAGFVAGCGSGEETPDRQTPDSLRNTIHVNTPDISPEDINRGYYVRNGDTVRINASDSSAATIGPAPAKKQDTPH